MKCKNHINEVAIEKCTSCGSWFCDSCTTVKDNLPYCNICLGNKTPNKETETKTETSTEIKTEYTREIVSEKRDFNPRAKIVQEKLDEIGYTGLVEDAGSIIDLNDKRAINQHNLKIKEKMMAGYALTPYERSKEKKKILGKFIAGGILIALSSPVTVIIGLAVIGVGIIDAITLKKH